MQSDAKKFRLKIGNFCTNFHFLNFFFLGEIVWTVDLSLTKNSPVSALAVNSPLATKSSLLRAENFFLRALLHFMVVL